MKILITGTNSGIGKLLYQMLKEDGHIVYGVDIEISDDNITTDMVCDVTNPVDVEILKQELSFIPDVIINNAGCNILNWIEELTYREWDTVMNTNAKSIFIMAKVFSAALKCQKGTMINILSNAANRPMTNSLVYNASKAAAEMMTKQISREWSPHGVCVFGISPNKIKGTGMSRYVDTIVPILRGWTPEYAREYERKNLPAGEETPIYRLVQFIRFLLASKENHRYLAGTIIPYGY